MAKSTVVVTNSWQQVATGAVVITIESQGSDVILFDEAQNDATAYKSSSPVGDQFQQSETVATWVRSDGEGWVIIVDGVL